MLQYKVSDEDPPLVVELQTEAGWDLTGGQTVSFRLIRPDGTLEERDCDILDGTINKVRHNWTDGDFDQAGLYKAQFISNDSGLERTFPPKGHISINVEARLEAS